MKEDFWSEGQKEPKLCWIYSSTSRTSFLGLRDRSLQQIKPASLIMVQTGRKTSIKKIKIKILMKKMMIKSKVAHAFRILMILTVWIRKMTRKILVVSVILRRRRMMRKKEKWKAKTKRTKKGPGQKNMSLATKIDSIQIKYSHEFLLFLSYLSIYLYFSFT